MAARSSMAALITRVRDLINDPSGSPTWTDNQIQDVLDAGRVDYRYLRLAATPDWSTGAIRFLDYYAPWGDWEADYTFAQYYTTTVTPSTTEPIVGHITFATSTFPPVYIAFGKSYDIYRAAADLLERWAAQWVMAYMVIANGQRLERQQVAVAYRDLAKQYRQQQRARSISMTRNDSLRSEPVSLRAKPVDYITPG
jgi:hypothetical protein